jgi:hypothetical protein
VIRIGGGRDFAASFKLPMKIRESGKMHLCKNLDKLQVSLYYKATKKNKLLYDLLFNFHLFRIS